MNTPAKLAFKFTSLACSLFLVLASGCGCTDYIVRVGLVDANFKPHNFVATVVLLDEVQHGQLKALKGDRKKLMAFFSDESELRVELNKSARLKDIELSRQPNGEWATKPIYVTFPAAVIDKSCTHLGLASNFGGPGAGAVHTRLFKPDKCKYTFRLEAGPAIVWDNEAGGE